MALKPPTTYSRAVRRTLQWLVKDEWIDRSLEATGETCYLLCHAQRLHESFERLPLPADNPRCLVVGSWGIEVPYLYELGWHDIVCLCAPRHKVGRRQSVTRTHPNTDKEYPFTLIEHDVESGRLPFEADTFSLIVFWGCFEHLRRDPEYALYELNRVSKPGAVISLVTDNAISFQATHSLLRGNPMPMRLHWPESEGHWRLYSPREIEELLRGTGWQADLLTSIVPDPPVYWRWWKRWLFKRLVSNYREGFGLAEPYWNAFVLAQGTKVAQPSRTYPRWLYKDERIMQLKLRMMELVSHEPAACLTA